MSLTLALDIGGTKIEAALVDSQMQVSYPLRIETKVEQGKDGILETITRSIHSLIAQTPAPLKGIGVALPGFIEDHGNIIFAGSILKDLTGFNLKQYLGETFHLPIEIDNDANCFALAEATWGAGQHFSHVLGVIWGSGIGSGLVINGQLYRGATGGAGELGHILIKTGLEKDDAEPKPELELRDYSTLENLASGYYLTKRYLHAGGTIHNPDPAKLYGAKDDALAQKILGEAIDYLALGLATATNLFNPNCIVLGGGVSNLPDAIYDLLNEKLKRYALPSLTQNLQIVRHQISDSAGLLGAAQLIFEKYDKSI